MFPCKDLWAPPKDCCALETVFVFAPVIISEPTSPLIPVPQVKVTKVQQFPAPVPVPQSREARTQLVPVHDPRMDGTQLLPAPVPFLQVGTAGVQASPVPSPEGSQGLLHICTWTCSSGGGSWCLVGPCTGPQGEAS